MPRQKPGFVLPVGPPLAEVESLMQNVTIDDEQRKRLDSFIKQKQKIGLMKNAEKTDFINEGELGKQLYV